MHLTWGTNNMRIDKQFNGCPAYSQGLKSQCWAALVQRCWGRFCVAGQGWHQAWPHCSWRGCCWYRCARCFPPQAALHSTCTMETDSSCRSRLAAWCTLPALGYTYAWAWVWWKWAWFLFSLEIWKPNIRTVCIPDKYPNAASTHTHTHKYLLPLVYSATFSMTYPCITLTLQSPFYIWLFLSICAG